MSEDNQIELPPSFIALFQSPSGKLTASRADITERYGLCEDFAHLVTETAMSLFHQLHVTESDVLQRCYQGMLGDAAIVSAEEARWVVCRLAELCNWPQPNAEFFGA